MNKLSKFMFVAALTALSPLTSIADTPGRHPAYLHAITDLRTAREFLTHQTGDTQVYEGEGAAVIEINHALDELKHIAVEDGKNIQQQEPVDVHENGSRLAKAIEALSRAKKNISQQEDNPAAREGRVKVEKYIDDALKDVIKAHDVYVKEQKEQKH